MNHSPTVSVLIPTYNRSALLFDVLQSFSEQPLRDIEILVMDDGSNDNTKVVVEELRDDRIRYFLRNRRGPTENLNEAIRKSTGKYIMVAHDHDFYDAGMLSEFAAALDRHPTAGFAFCSYVFVDSTGTAEVQKWERDWPELLNGAWFLNRILLPYVNSPVLGLSMIRRTALKDRAFDVAVGACADVELWHRLSAEHDVVYVNQPLIRVRLRDDTSLFSGSSAAVDMLDKVLNTKKKYLKDVDCFEARALIRFVWRLQVDLGGIYVFWKAFGANDWDTVSRMKSLSRREGTTFGYLGLVFLAMLPRRAGALILRGIRTVYRAISLGRTKTALS